MGIFDEIAARVDAEAPDPLNQLAFTGVQQNPDELAGAMKLGKRVGVPTEFAMDPKLRPGFEQDDKLATTQQKLQNLGPRAQGWVSKDRHNIGLVYDELDALGSIESAFDRAKRVSADRARAENYRTGTGAAEGFGRGLLTGAANLAKAGTDVRHATVQATVGRLFGGKVGSTVNKAVDPIMPDYALGQGGQALADALAPGQRQTASTFIRDPKTGQEFINPGALNPLTGPGLENLSQIAAQEAVPMAAMMAVTALSDGALTPLLAAKYGQNLAKLGKLGRYAATLLKHSTTTVAAIEGARTISGQYESGIQQVMAERHLSREEAEVVVAPGALLAGMLSTPAGGLESRFMGDLWGKVAKAPGGKTLLAKIAQKGAAMVKKGGEEALQETVQGGGEDLAEWITYNPDKTIKEVAANMLMNAAGGFVIGGPSGAFHGSRPAETNQLMTDISNAAKASKLNQRASDKFQDAVQEMAGDQENLLIPADRYFQTVTDAGLDPAELAQSLGVENLQEAMEAGTDVVIPVGAYAAQIAATDLHGKLAQDIRLNPGDATMREEQEAGKLAEDEAAKATEDAQGLQVQAEIDALPVPAVEQFQAKRQAQLEAAGFAPDAAAEQARWHAQVFDVLAGSEGLTVEQMDQMFPLEVSGVRSGEGKKSLTDLALDRLKAMGTGIKEYAQSVFHGSPYRFDKFSLEHMGKGEGAQAYGWGLYFAGNKAIAEYYRNALAGKTGITWEQMDVMLTEANGGTPIRYQDFAAREIRRQDNANPKLDSMSVAKKAQYAKIELRDIPTEKIAQIIDKMREAEGGQLYEADIPDDGAYLLWDKPLSEQPEAVKKALEVGIEKYKNILDAYNKIPDEEIGSPEFERIDKERLAYTAFEDIAARSGKYDGNSIYHALSSGNKKGEAASRLLNSLGVAGIKYEDGSSRGKDGEKSFNYVVFDDSAVKVLKTFYQRGGGRYASDKEARAARARRAGQNTQASMDKAKMDAHNADEAEFSVFDSAVKELQAGDILNDKRGFIQVTPDRQFHIGLLEGRDLSTFLHESGHYFLEVMGDLAERPEASERVKGMWADTLKSFGVDSREAITTEHHEQFAGQMERYLMEGKAPSEKLKPMFQRFKSWLMLVYKQMDKIGVRINDDVRSVFDRIMATDAEIEAHRPQVETFATAKDMGVSEKEFEIYQKAKAGAMEEGRDRLQGEVMKDLLREQKAAYKGEKAQARADVEVGVDSRPDMKAIVALTDPNNQIKLNRQAVQDQFGDARGLPVVEGGGMDAEAAAEMLGFDSGAQLYQALKDAPTRKDLIDTLTDEIMFARYGDVTLDGTIADKAVEALHNDKQADVLAMELRAMKRLQRIAEKVGKAKEGQDKEAQRAADAQIPGVNAFREQARQMISGMSLRQMEPNKYRLAGEKYSKEAYKLKGKKDYQGAANAKQRELLNHFLYLEAKKGQEEAGKIYDYARSLEGSTAQGKLGKAGRVFQDQVNALLDRYQFAKETLKALDARQSLLEFVREQEANGEAVMIDPDLLNEARRMNYREVPLTELRAVRDALKNIQTIAYRQLEMDIDGKHVAKDEAKAEMIASALLNFKAKPLPFSGSDLTLKESASKWLKGKSAMFTKMERVIDWLDGGKIDGPWRSYIFNRIAKAEINEFDLNTAITQKFIEAFEKMDPKHRLSMTDSVGVTLPGMDRPLNRRQAITFLLNMGNDQNQEKLLEGYGWTSPQAIGMVGDALGNLTPGDLEFVNTTWKTINALWPSIEALEFKMTGLSPEKVDARPFAVTLKDGSQHMMEGGYFPIVYDPSRSPQGAKQIEGNVNELTDKGFSRPNTPHGFTKARVKFSAPILLNFEHTLTRHLSQVIKDVTHREAVTDIYSLITSQDIRDALNETIGEPAQKQFLPWLKSVVNDRNGAGTQGLEEFSSGIMAVRSNLITATLAFRLSSVIVQATDLVRAMDRVKPRFMAEAFASFMSAQRLGHNELVDEMREKSGEMRHRPGSFDRDMRVVLQKGFGDQPIKKRVAEFGAHGLSCADAITSTITWVGAYRQALAAGSDEAEAIAEADRTVRLVLQAGSPKDLTPIQKGGALEKLLTMYAGDSFATYGIMQDAGRNYKKGGVKDTPKWAARMLFAVLMPAIIADVIKGRMPEDDEDKAKWIAWKAGLSFFNTLPIIRDVSSSLESGYDYKFTPVAEAIAKAGRAIHSTGKMIEGEKDPVDVAFQGIDAVGTLWGVPGTSQLMQTSKYLYKVSQGEENPDNAAQLVKNAILGKSKK